MNQFLREQRLYNNGLQKKFKDADSCVTSLMGIQSQLHYYGLISIFSRTRNTSIQKIAQSENLIKSWGQRSTHHIYAVDDYPTINKHLIKTGWPLSYLQEQGVDTDHVIKTLSAYCDTHDTFTRDDLLVLFPESKQDALNVWSSLIIIGCTQGLMYVSVLEDNTKAYRSAKHFNKNAQEMASLLKRYFSYYGPATVKDFAHWSGLPQKSFIDAFNTIKDDLFCTDKTYYSLDKPKKHTLDYPIILGKFDPLLVSYFDKSWIIGDHAKDMIWRKAAHVEGVIIDETGLCATWHYDIKPKSITYVIKPLYQINLDFAQKKFEAISNFMNRETTFYDIEEPYYTKTNPEG